MKKSIVTSLIICVCIVPTAVAQLRLASLQEVWTYADTHNIQLQAANTEKETASINVKQAKGSVLPTVSANGAFTDNIKIQPTLIPADLFNPTAPAGAYTEATFGRRYIYNGNLNVQFDLINSKDWFTIKAAKLSNEMASLHIATQKQSLYEQLANVYYTYLLLNEAENLFTENVKTADKSYQAAANKFKEGLINEVTLNTALINKEKAEKALEATVENKSLQLNTLQSILNTTDSIVITEALQDVNPIMANNSFSIDPNVRLADMQLQAAKNEWKASKAAFAPALSAMYQYNTQVAADEFLKFSNSNTMPQQYWGLRLSIPIFSGNSRKYEVQKAKIEYNLKQKEVESARLRADITSQSVLIAYNSSVNTYTKSKRILSLHQSNDAHAERRLNEGIISLDERLKSYSDLISNQNEYLQSLSDYLIQQYRLQIRQTNFIK